MTKAEFYKGLIDIQIKTGQGVSGMLKLGTNGDLVSIYLDELIEEGLVVANDTGGSLGHPETNIFYTPTKGYNVWADEGTDGVYNRHKGRYLSFVRLFLGSMEQNYSEDQKDEKTNQKNYITPSVRYMVTNPEIMKMYTEWLERNHDALEEMISLDNFYPGDKQFSDEENEWIKSRGWYGENKTVAECIKRNGSERDNNEELASTLKRMLRLLKQDPTNYASDIEKYEGELEEAKKMGRMYRKLNGFMQMQDGSTRIQDLI